MLRHALTLCSITILLTACADGGDATKDSPDVTDTETSEETDVVEDTDADTDDTDADTDAADTDTDGTSGAKGDGFYATATIAGTAETFECPDVKRAFGELPNILNFIAGNDLNIGCGLDHPNGFVGRSVFLKFDDRDALVTGPLTEDSAGGMELSVNGANNESVSMTSSNLESFTLTGSFDATTRRATGSFSGSWGTPNNAFEHEVDISGTFDMILIDLEE